MIESRYSRGVRIIGAHVPPGTPNKGLRSTRPLPSAFMAKGFVRLTTGHLAELSKLKTGKALLDAIDASGKTVTILLGKNSAAFEADENVDSINDKMIKAFRPAGRAQRTQEIELYGVPGRREDWVDKLPLFRAPRNEEEKTDRSYLEERRVFWVTHYTRELTAALDRAGSPSTGLAGYTRAFVARAVGKTEDELRRMERAELVPDDDTYKKLCFVLYRWLTPGIGIDAAVRHDISEEPTHEGPRPVFDDGNVRPPAYIVLGHELIHAWRMTVGRRLSMTSSWEEEAMTVGIPPFSYFEFTENRLRAEAGLPIRIKYTGQTAQFANDYMTMSNALGVTARGTLELRTGTPVARGPVVKDVR